MCFATVEFKAVPLLKRVRFSFAEICACVRVCVTTKKNLNRKTRQEGKREKKKKKRVREKESERERREREKGGDGRRVLRVVQRPPAGCTKRGRQKRKGHV